MRYRKKFRNGSGDQRLMLQEIAAAISSTQEETERAISDLEKEVDKLKKEIKELKGE